jgi:hypothetical protein
MKTHSIFVVLLLCGCASIERRQPFDPEHVTPATQSVYFTFRTRQFAVISDNPMNTPPRTSYEVDWIAPDGLYTTQARFLSAGQRSARCTLDIAGTKAVLHPGRWYVVFKREGRRVDGATFMLWPNVEGK